MRQKARMRSVPVFGEANIVSATLNAHFLRIFPYFKPPNDSTVVPRVHSAGAMNGTEMSAQFVNCGLREVANGTTIVASPFRNAQLGWLTIVDEIHQHREELIFVHEEWRVFAISCQLKVIEFGVLPTLFTFTSMGIIVVHSVQ